MTREYDEEDEEYEEEYEYEYEAQEAGEGSTLAAGDPLNRSLALGFLAMVPMFLVYEFALVATRGSERNTSELVLFRLFAPFGEWSDLARRVVLGVAAVYAFVYCLRRHWALGPRIARVVLEGAVGAIAIGPALIGLVHLLGDSLPPLVLSDGPEMRAPGLAQAAFVFGAGAYEEIVFRVGAYSALYFCFLRVGQFLGFRLGISSVLGEIAGLFGSAALFSAFHLAVFVAWLGPGGEEFDLSIFTYRALAGMLLGILFRWRGPGVAAWTHGLFNLALLLGAGPEVFL